MDRKSPPDSPFLVVKAPEPPRLSILHLLVWTACVAFYLGMARFIYVDLGALGEQWSGLWGLSGIGQGTALAGLLLWAARRWRRIPFPVHPGEYLVVAFGVATLLHLVQLGCFPWMQLANAEGDARPVFYVTSALSVITYLVMGVIYVIAIVRIKVRRWRVYFALAIVVAVNTWLATIAGSRLFGPVGVFMIQALRVTDVIVLLIVAGMDLRRRVRYPWTHWLGVVLRFWYAGVTIAMIAYMVFFTDMP